MKLKYKKIVSLTVVSAMVALLFAMPVHAALCVDNGTIITTNSTTKADYDSDFGDVVQCDKFGANGIYNMYFTGNSYKGAGGQGPYRLFVSTDLNSDLLYSNLGNSADGAVQDYVGTAYIATDTLSTTDAWAHIGHMTGKAWAASVTNHTFEDGALSAEKLTKLDYVVRYSDGTKVVKDIYLDNKLYKTYTGAPTNNRTKFDEFVISIQYAYNAAPSPINIYVGDMSHRVVAAGYVPGNGNVTFTDAGGVMEAYAQQFEAGEDFHIPSYATVADILGMEGKYEVFEVRAEDGTVITTESDEDILSDSADGYYIYTVGQGSSDNNGLYSRICADFPEYYSDPGYISDSDFFGVWEESAWTTMPMLNYGEYDGLADVEAAVKSGNYSLAKEQLLSYYKDKISGYSLSSKANGKTIQYLDYLMYKHNMLYATGAGVTPVGVMTAGGEWGWIEQDITSFVGTAKTLAFELTALTKDDSVVEIKSRDNGTDYAPRIEAYVNGSKVVLEATADSYISAGTNTYKTFGTDDADMLKVAESTSSIGKLDDPVDENTFRTYMKFDLSSIGSGDTVTGAVIKLYARSAGSNTAKEMMLFNTGELTWSEADISWGCGDITQCMYSFDGDSMPGWDMTEAAFANPRMVTKPVRFETSAPNVVGYYQTTRNEEVMYHLIRMLNSYITMVPDPSFNNNLSAGQRAWTFSELVAYCTESPMLTADVFTGFVKYIKTLGDYLTTEDAFDPANNWGVYESSSLLGLAWQFIELSNAPEWEQTASERLEFMAGNVSFSDGSSVECALDYAKQSLSLFTSRLLSLAEMFNTDLSAMEFSSGFFNELYKQGRYIMDTSGPGFSAVQYGDDTAYTNNFKYYLKTTGNLLNKQDLIWAGAGGPDGTKGTAPDYSSVLYPVKGMATMRSDWTKQGLWLQINNDKARSSHGHYDDLSVIVFANGKYLLADPGIYVYDPDDDPIRKWQLSTEAHNSVMINNTTQKADIKSDVPGLITGWETNDTFDYVSMMTDAYEGFEHTRDVLFIRDKFWIVNDFISPEDKSALNQYDQLWHFLPEADISVDAETMETRTNFGDADLRVIPVGTEDYQPVNNFSIEAYHQSGNLAALRQDSSSSGIKVGYYSNGYGKVSDAEYSSYRKVNVAGDTAFKTILFPVTSGNDYNIEAADIDTDADETTASAMKLTYSEKNTDDETVGIFYNLHNADDKDECAVENYSTDGSTMYVERDNGALSFAILREGTHIKDTSLDAELIKSIGNVGAVSVRWQSGDIYIEAMNDLNLEDITIYNGDKTISNVYLNGVALAQDEFSVHGRYVNFGDREFSLAKDETAKTFRATGIPEGDAVLIVAEFDETGSRLTDVLAVTFLTCGEAFDETFVIENYEDKKIYKAFLWQSSNLAPLVDFQEL